MKEKSNKTIQEKDELYEKYKKIIYTVLSDLHCNIENKDQFEEYYLIAEYGLAKAINSITGDWKNSKSSYFYTLIKNEVINYFDYRTRLKRMLDGTNMADIDECVIDSGINIEEEYLIQEKKEELHNAINNLKPMYKDVIVKIFGIGMEKKTIKEIADEYKISCQGVQQRKKYALKSLRKELIKNLDE